MLEGKKHSEIVVDISKNEEYTFYTVESDEEGVPGGAGEEGSNKLFICTASEIEKIPAEADDTTSGQQR